MACWKGESSNYNEKIVSGLFWTPTRCYAHAKSGKRFNVLQLYISSLCVGAASIRCSEQFWNYFPAVIQWFNFPTSHHLTPLNNVGRFYSGLTEIVRFSGVIHFCTNVRPLSFLFYSFVMGYGQMFKVAKNTFCVDLVGIVGDEPRNSILLCAYLVFQRFSPNRDFLEN